MSPVIVVDMPVQLPQIVDAYPDQDTHFIYEHLRYYCTKFDPLPAITVQIEQDEALVVRGHKYLRIARELGRASIPAVVTGESVDRFVEKHQLRRVDWRAELERPASINSHVFFFERPLSADEQAVFERDVGGFFRRLGTTNQKTTEISFPNDLAAAEIRAFTPTRAEGLAGRLLEICRAFSATHVRILSYQGGKFPSDQE